VLGIRAVCGLAPLKILGDVRSTSGHQHFRLHPYPPAHPLQYPRDGRTTERVPETGEAFGVSGEDLPGQENTWRMVVLCQLDRDTSPRESRTQAPEDAPTARSLNH
jgi:hypothetical protein